MLNMHFLYIQKLQWKKAKKSANKYSYAHLQYIAYHGVRKASIKVTREGRLSISISSQLPPAFASIATALTTTHLSRNPMEECSVVIYGLQVKP